MKQNGIRGKGNKLPIYSHNHLIKQANNEGSSLIRVRKEGILNHVYDLRSQKTHSLPHPYLSTKQFQLKEGNKMGTEV